MRELVDEGQCRVPIDDGVDIHLFDAHALVLELLSRDDLEAGGELSGFRTGVGFDEANDDVGATLFAAVELLEGGIGLAHTRRYAKVDAVPSARAGASLAADALEHRVGGGTPVPRRNPDVLLARVNHGRAQ